MFSRRILALCCVCSYMFFAYSFVISYDVSIDFIHMHAASIAYCWMLYRHDNMVQTHIQSFDSMSLHKYTGRMQLSTCTHTHLNKNTSIVACTCNVYDMCELFVLVFLTVAALKAYQHYSKNITLLAVDCLFEIHSAFFFPFICYAFLQILLFGF